MFVIVYKAKEARRLAAWFEHPRPYRVKKKTDMKINSFFSGLNSIIRQHIAVFVCFFV